MAISRTPALFAQVDLFSRSRVIICYLPEIIFSCRRKRHWKWQKHCKLCASCNYCAKCHVWQMVGHYLISLARKLKSYNQGFCRLCKLVDIHLYLTAWAWNRPWIFQGMKVMYSTVRKPHREIFISPSLAWRVVSYCL